MHGLLQDEKQALKSCVDKILQATQIAAAVDPAEAQGAKDEDVTAFLEKHAEDRRRQSEVSTEGNLTLLFLHMRWSRTA